MNGIHSYYEDMLRPFKDNTIMPNSLDDIIKLIKRDDLKNPEISDETNLALKNYYDIDTKNDSEKWQKKQ